MKLQAAPCNISTPPIFDPGIFRFAIEYDPASVEAMQDIINIIW